MTTTEHTTVDGDRYIVPGLKRGLQILQLFGPEQPSMRLSTLAQQLGISRSSTFRLAYTLESMGFIERDADRNCYRLGSRVLDLGFAHMSALEIVEVAGAELESLRDATNFSAHLAVLDGREVVYVARVPSRNGITSNIAVGERRPAHLTPIGRVLLSAHSDQDLAELYRGVRLQVRTEQTPTTLKMLRQALNRVRKSGYEVSRGSYGPGGCSVAAPILDTTGTIVAAISISGPLDAHAETSLEHEFKDHLLMAVERVSGRLGYRPRKLKGR